MEKRGEEIALSNRYEKYQNTATWDVVWQTIDELVENNDLLEQTPRGYIVGYICEKLEQEKLNKE